MIRAASFEEQRAARIQAHQERMAQTASQEDAASKGASSAQQFRKEKNVQSLDGAKIHIQATPQLRNLSGTALATASDFKSEQFVMDQEDKPGAQEKMQDKAAENEESGENAQKWHTPKTSHSKKWGWTKLVDSGVSGFDQHTVIESEPEKLEAAESSLKNEEFHEDPEFQFVHHQDQVPSGHQNQFLNQDQHSVQTASGSKFLFVGHHQEQDAQGLPQKRSVNDDLEAQIQELKERIAAEKEASRLLYQQISEFESFQAEWKSPRKSVVQGGNSAVMKVEIVHPQTVFCGAGSGASSLSEEPANSAGNDDDYEQRVKRVHYRQWFSDGAIDPADPDFLQGKRAGRQRRRRGGRRGRIRYI